MTNHDPQILPLGPDPRRDHRTLFTLEEVTAAYQRILPEREALAAAQETMSGPIVPGQPAFFTDDLLVWLSELSADVARRVQIARGP
jgi:hypothetical protein